MKETMVTHLAEVGITTTVENIVIGEEPKKESYNRRSVAMVAELGDDADKWLKMLVAKQPTQSALVDLPVVGS